MKGHTAWSALQFGFPCHQAIISVPGQILADSIKATRTMPKPAPNFLHVDGDAQVTEDHDLTVIDGKPMEPERLYKIGIYQLLLTGLNVIEPLFSWVRNNIAEIPDEEACPPAKEICIEVCMKEAWRELLGFADDASVAIADLESHLESTFKQIDTNGDGNLERKEIEEYFHQAMGEKPQSTFLSKMIAVLDANNDGMISYDELQVLVAI